MRIFTYVVSSFLIVVAVTVFGVGTRMSLRDLGLKREEAAIIYLLFLALIFLTVVGARRLLTTQRLTSFKSFWRDYLSNSYFKIWGACSASWTIVTLSYVVFFYDFGYKIREKDVMYILKIGMIPIMVGFFVFAIFFFAIKNNANRQ